MQVSELKNYGKDIITIQKEMSISLKKKLALMKSLFAFVGRLLWHMNPIGLYRFIKKVKKEKQLALKLDWTHVKDRGISEENLSAVISKQVVAKAMVDILGYEKASMIRGKFSDKCAYHIFEEVFAKPEEFINCGNGDFLKAFKEYYIALSDAMGKAGLEYYEIGIDTKDCFQLNITYCVYNEVAKVLGNTMNCYYSTCYGDEVYFPKLCEQANFEFKREGTLATGNHCCDMTFIRR